MYGQSLAYQDEELSDIVGFRVLASPIQEMLLSIGVPPNIYGYAYITYAVELLLRDSDYQHYVTKGLYVDIAKRYKTTPSRVERAIRHAINVAWLHGNTELINHVFRNCVRPDRGVPSNSVFLARLFYYIKDASGK
ncbi:MAG: sporulation initiation factor Spo0A C-terminal domain-containing protein [Lachnospiraceae bacterium]|nr:sporulation initiation factor Spo0A C-terminal domain-containing protein [Lachnospiraceae bacterium]